MGDFMVDEAKDVALQLLRDKAATLETELKAAQEKVSDRNRQLLAMEERAQLAEERLTEAEARDWFAYMCDDIMENQIAKGFITTKENMLEKLMLVVTECAEAAEDVRHAKWDHFGEELADILIRVMNIGATLGINLKAEVNRKHEINKKRPYRHGKKSTA